MRDPYATDAASPYLNEMDAGSGELILGRYRVLETRGTGGFGTVEVCWDERLRRRVAIKCMPLHAANAQAQATVEEALTEARMSSMLQHPNIVTMFDFESDGYYAYLVMEYVDGLTLEELLSRVEGGSLSFEECAHVLDSVASALAYAHQNGVLHLDIKPANIMIEHSGTVKLGDFGMATLASATGYGDARGGTVGYMPPEQIEGGLVDERCDLFALAVVMWRALTGRQPFAAARAEDSLAKIIAGPKPRLSKIQPLLEGPVENAFMSALDPQVTTRMASVEQFADIVVENLRVDPRAGQESLRNILSSLSDSDADVLYVPERRPLRERFPQLPSVVIRALAAATCAWTAYAVGPTIGLRGQTQLFVAIFALAVAGAAAPILGSALALIGIVLGCALGTGGVLSAGGIASTVGNLTGSDFLEQGAQTVAEVALGALQPVLLALVVVGVGLVFGLWWLSSGRSHDLAGTALLAGSALSAPVACVPLAGWGLSPGRALATGSLGWLIATLFKRLGTHGLSSMGVLATLINLVSDPGAWVMLVGCGLAAWIVSIFAHRTSVGWAIFGFMMGFSLWLVSLLVSLWVENGGIWLVPQASEVGLAVLLFGLTALLCWVLGTQDNLQEVD